MKLFSLLCLLVGGSAFAQKLADPPKWRQWELGSSDTVPADKALNTFKIAPGFELQLFAAEPMVVDPVAMAWDGDGRAWVVEMRGYMPDVKGTNETKLKTGKVVVLEDTNNDGKADKKTDFLDELIMPRAIAMVDGGVLVSEPPTLWYCQDTNGDLKCDKKTKVGNYARQGPVEHTDNGLVPCLDNWMYNAKSSKRFMFRDGSLITGNSRSRGQWGICQDDYGRLYTTSNSRYMNSDWDMYHGAAGAFSNPSVGTADINSIRPNPGINRGYKPEMLRKDGRLARITAISGPGVYRSNRYPEGYAGAAFIPEPAANAVTCHWFDETEKGLGRGIHKLYSDKDFEKREFLCSTDERFRPVSIYNGPDGCIYVVDMYRGILQHKAYVTSFYLKPYILERKLEVPVGMGRIYRIVNKSKGRNKTQPRLQKASMDDLVKTLSHPNGWWRDTAQRLLVERRDKKSIPTLKEVVNSADNHLAKVHALWTLEGMDALDLATVSEGLEDKHEKVQMTALVVSGRLRATPEQDKAIAALEPLKKSKFSQVAKLSDQMIKRLNGQIIAKSGGPPKIRKMPKGEHGESVIRGVEVYNTLCITCHLADGKGAENLAPPLANSDWVSGSQERLIRIALHGVQGPITVNGNRYRHPEIMPGMGAALKDRQIADVLSYVRTAWGGKSRVEEQDVKRVRGAHKDRVLPWNVKELLELK
ncbi:MAG: c-type cytochrome [Opitutae bacterium]|nr:c-type cytochrome [Opitutae bacterium]